ncbi:MAG TPA: ClpX C4-type zinc finger protein [Vicinamibacterales bacterium]|jgi:ornithine cyclodeaminase
MPELQKISAENAAAEGLQCSFCNRKPADGSDLIAGPEAVICDECIAACNEMIAAADEEPEDAADGEEAEPDDVTPAVRPTFFRLLTEGDVTALLPIDTLMEPMEQALRRFSAGEVVQPVRTVLPIGREFFGVMPAYVRNPPIIGAKLVSVFPKNTAVHLPTHLATVLLFSPDTGALLAVVGGSYITEVRTAAVSAVSANLLARDDASRVAIIGSGTQARSHLRALEEVFELSEVRVWSPTPEHQDAFIEEMETRTTARLVGVDSAEQAVQAADIVVLATSSADPVVQSEWIKSGTHVISVGACRPDQREMDPALVLRGRLFVDSRAAALAESGDVVMAIQERRFTESHIVGELGELIDGKVEGRRSPREVTIFKSLGLAVEDVMAAELAYRRALAGDSGRELEL